MSGSHGDQLRSAFDEVFCPLLPRLYRRAALLAGSHAAEDAVHEVYLKLVAGPQRFLAHPEPYAYAFAALVSTVRDAYRRGSRQVLTAEIGGGRDPGGGAGGAAGGGWDRGWDGGFEARAAELEAVRLLGRLTVQQAAAVILVDLDGYTIDQAAEILRLHRGTVSRARLRALDKLRGTLGGGRSRIAEGHQDHAPQSTA
jgi:RNA polymerase sigma-70 factor (ECF subfamily)